MKTKNHTSCRYNSYKYIITCCQVVYQGLH
nr:MAG TPA: Type-A lantibiotic [Caudoviricetes sp.]